MAQPFLRVAAFHGGALVLLAVNQVPGVSEVEEFIPYVRLTDLTNGLGALAPNEPGVPRTFDYRELPPKGRGRPFDFAYRKSTDGVSFQFISSGELIWSGELNSDEARSANERLRQVMSTSRSSSLEEVAEWEVRYARQSKLVAEAALAARATRQQALESERLERDARYGSLAGFTDEQIALIRRFLSAMAAAGNPGALRLDRVCEGWLIGTTAEFGQTSSVFSESETTMTTTNPAYLCTDGSVRVRVPASFGRHKMREIRQRLEIDLPKVLGGVLADNSIDYL